MLPRGGIRSLIALSLVGTGCSWLAVTPPGLPSNGGDCTESTAAPTADTVGASLLGIVGAAGLVLMVAAAKASSPPPGQGGVPNAFGVMVGGAALGGSLLFGIPYAISAYYGFDRTARCKALKVTPRAAEGSPLASPPREP